MGLVLFVWKSALRAQSPSEHLAYTCHDANGSPVPKAEAYLVEYRWNEKQEREIINREGPILSDAQGRLTFVTSGQATPFYRLVYARVPGKWVGGLYHRVPPENNTSPELFDIQLEPTQTVEGRAVVPVGYTLKDVRCLFAPSDESLLNPGNPAPRNEFQSRLNLLASLFRPDDPWSQLIRSIPDEHGTVRDVNFPSSLAVGSMDTQAPGLAENDSRAIDHLFFARLEPEQIVTGEVNDAARHPIPGVKVKAYVYQPGPAIDLHALKFDASTDALGRFTLHGLMSGQTYGVTATPPKGDVTRRIILEGPRATPPASLTFTIEPGIIVSGSYPPNQGGVAVYMGSKPDRALSVIPTLNPGNGTFTVALPSGESCVTLSAEFYGPTGSLERTFVNQTLNLVQGQKPPLVTLRFPPSDGKPIDYHGRVIDEKGNGMAGISVQVFCDPQFHGNAQDTWFDYDKATAHTDAAGNYTVSLVPRKGYQIAAEGPATTRAIAPFFDVVEGDTTTLPDLKIAPANGVVSGHIVDAAGKPVPDLLMHASAEHKVVRTGISKPDVMSPSNPPAIWGGVTDATGYFAFGNLPTDEPITIHFNSNAYITKLNLNRDVLVQSGASDLVIQAEPLLEALSPNPGLTRNRPAPPWSVETWLKKSFPPGVSAPPQQVRTDGKWTVLILLPTPDPSLTWSDLAASIRQMGAEPVVIWGDRIDRSLPEHLLTEQHLDIPMAIDRFGGVGGVTSDAYQPQSIGGVVRLVVLIDPKGVVRAFDYFENQKTAWEKFQSLIATPTE